MIYDQIGNGEWVSRFGAGAMLQDQVPEVCALEQSIEYIGTLDMAPLDVLRVRAINGEGAKVFYGALRSSYCRHTPLPSGTQQATGPKVLL